MRGAARIIARFGVHALRLLGRGPDACSGMAAVEFALIGPILVLATICTVDLGMGIHRNMQVQNAAQTGAEYAATHGFDPSAIAAVTAAAASSTIAASPAPARFCGCATSSGVVEAACGSTCAGGALVGTYVRVSAQSTYTPLLPYPMLQASYDLRAQATMRVE
jgi:Flp pilus assembly protein TadG